VYVDSDEGSRHYVIRDYRTRRRLNESMIQDVFVNEFSRDINVDTNTVSIFYSHLITEDVYDDFVMIFIMNNNGI